MKSILLAIFFCFLLCVGWSQNNYPVPPAANNRLFFIQHSSNKNTYVYDANFTKSKLLNEAEPVTIYRLMYAEGGERKELTFPQLKFGYGLNVSKVGKNHYELSLVSYPRQKFLLKTDSKGKAYVETTVNGRQLFLQRMFLQARAGSSGLSIKPDHIMFYGRDAKGKAIVEKFYPQ